MFADRVDGGRQLARALTAYQGDPGTVVLGIPRGGVIVAAEVARLLELPLGAAVAAKVGAPGNPEYAVGAVAADGVVLANPEAGYPAEQVDAMAGAARSKVSAETRRLNALGAAVDVTGRTAILVDDGLATGLTAMAAAGWLRRAGAARVIVAVPVASPSAAEAMRGFVDEVVAVERPDWFSAVGGFYRDFGQTEDAEVDRVIVEARGRADRDQARGE